MQREATLRLHALQLCMLRIHFELQAAVERLTPMHMHNMHMYML